MKPGWLLLLSISAGVWSVPIDRNVGNQEAKEEVQEENGVMVSVVSVIYHLMCFHSIRFTDLFLTTTHSCRTLACTTTGISER